MAAVHEDKHLEGREQFLVVIAYVLLCICRGTMTIVVKVLFLGCRQLLLQFTHLVSGCAVRVSSPRRSSSSLMDSFRYFLPLSMYPVLPKRSCEEESQGEASIRKNLGWRASVPRQIVQVD